MTETSVYIHHISTTMGECIQIETQGLWKGGSMSQVSTLRLPENQISGTLATYIKQLYYRYTLLLIDTR